MTSFTGKFERHSLPCQPKKKAAAVMAISMMLIILTSTALSLATEVKQQSFPTAEAAVAAMNAALKSNDTKALLAIFGSGSEQWASSGDPVADRVDRERFLDHFTEKHLLKAEGDARMVLYVGKDDWPFPIPIVKTDGAWRFDTEEGATEILARRIGRNELSTIQVCLAYIDAQREYAEKDRNGNGLLEYAQRLTSEPGTKNGLYWETGEDEEQSPFGPLVAEAQESGYLAGEPGEKSNGQPLPYHGYYYRILKAQGKDAPGGAYNYMAGDRMIGGFALVAYPAQYDSSGIMTFVTNHDGVVYQKDLGEDTDAIARAMTLFNPDSTWEAVKVTGPDAE